MTVSAPATVVGPVPALPMVMLFVLFVPILTVPRVVPVPPFTTTLPPVPPPVSLPPAIVTVPPVPPVPDSTPPVKLREPPFDPGVVYAAGWRERLLPLSRVVISGVCPPASASCPPVERVMFVWLICSVPVELAYPMVVLAFPAEDRVVAPVEERLVNAPVPGVVAPIAVLLIPEAVVVKLPEVMVRLLVPSPMVEALSPDRFNTPALAVRLRVPEERVNPFDAVRS